MILFALALVAYTRNKSKKDGCNSQCPYYANCDKKQKVKELIK